MGELITYEAIGETKNCTQKIIFKKYKLYLAITTCASITLQSHMFTMAVQFTLVHTVAQRISGISSDIAYTTVRAHRAAEALKINRILTSYWRAFHLPTVYFSMLK